MKIMVTGGRRFNDEDLIIETFRDFINDHGLPELLIVGDAPGADSLARVVAMELGIPVGVHYADWSLGLAGGPIRNQEMVDLKPDFCLPFPGYKGTVDCMNRCRKAGIPFYFAKKL